MGWFGPCTIVTCPDCEGRGVVESKSRFKRALDWREECSRCTGLRKVRVYLPDTNFVYLHDPEQGDVLPQFDLDAALAAHEDEPAYNRLWML